MTWASVARWTAILIAALGIADPAITTTQRVRPEVALIDDGDTELGARVASALAGDVTVIRGPHAGAAVTVLAGSSLPNAARAVTAPAFVVVPDEAAPIRVASVRAPGRTTLHSEVRIQVTLTGPRAGAGAEVALRYAGVDLDRVPAEPAASGPTSTATLSFVPVREGPVELTVVAAPAGGGPAAVSPLVIDVHDTPWRVLFFDARPSWMSTFIRRALEGDPRFDVATRVSTSRDVTVDIGRPPAVLTRPDLLDGFDAIVIGAPETLSAAEVGALESFARSRGGTVALAFDRRAAGPVDRVLGVATWTEMASPGPQALTSPTTGAASLTATEVAWPDRLPPGAEPLATFRRAESDEPAAVLWRTPLGAGAVIVSGAFDAWRFRATGDATFDPFWRATLAAAAARAPRAIEVFPASIAVRPGERVTVRAMIRRAALASGAREASAATVGTSVGASLEGAGAARRSLRVWPDGPVGHVRADFVAPAVAGRYEVVFADDDSAGRAVVVVADQSVRRETDGALLAAWASSRGGRLFTASELPDMVEAIDAAVARPSRPATSHPMRSAWWIVPFAAALGAEWWWRRRRDLR